MKSILQTGSLLPFYLWLALFYLCWISLVLAGDYLTVIFDHWPMAIAMAAGSYIAGSTPMGGGTIGFPVLVLMMDLPAALGRDFSFAIQSVGMTSASIYILCSRQQIEWPMLRAALPGVLIGSPIGIFLIAPLSSELFIKLLFASMWCSFGLIHLKRIKEITSYIGMTPHQVEFDHKIGFLVGILGSMTVASVTGVGIDMMIYMVLVLWCHADLRIAIPSSVLLMAFTSLVGITLKVSFGDIQTGTFENWLTAAPVVAIGAPLGAFVVSRIGRRPTLLLVSALCVIQFIWTLVHERGTLSSVTLAASLGGVVLFLLIFQAMYQQGTRMARRSHRSLKTAKGSVHE